MSERVTKPDSPKEISRRQLFGYLVAAGGLMAAGYNEGRKSRKQRKELSSEPDYIFHKVTQKEAEQGIVALIRGFFPDLSEEQVQHYIQSGLFVNKTAEADQREPTDIKEDDTVELYEPTN